MKVGSIVEINGETVKVVAITGSIVSIDKCVSGFSCWPASMLKIVQ